MQYSVDAIMIWLADIMLPFVRISAMFIVMVGFSARTVNTKLKVLTAFSIAFLIAPVIPSTGYTNLFSVEGYLLVAQQALIGIAIGYISQIFLNTFVMAGEAVSIQSGLAFASMTDPVNGINAAAISQFYLILATLLFWAFDGHLAMIKMVAFSFEALPIGSGFLDKANFLKIIAFGSWLFLATVTLALTPMVAMLIVNFTFGVMTRAAPQLNIFSIGFPISQIAGLVVVWMSMSIVMLHFEKTWTAAGYLMCEIAGC